MSIETTVRGNLHEFKGAVKQTWGKITSNEIEQMEGKTEKLIGIIMKKYSLTKAEAEKEVTKFMDNHKEELSAH